MFLDSESKTWILECTKRGIITPDAHDLILAADEKDDPNMIISYFTYRDGMMHCPICKTGSAMCMSPQMHNRHFFKAGYMLYPWSIPILLGKTIDSYGNPAHTNIILGGPGCGKSTFVAIASWFYCSLFPGFMDGIAAPTIRQNNAVEREFDKVFSGTRGAAFIRNTISTPILRRQYINDSEQHVFTTAVLAAGKEGSDRILGSEYDHMVYDEAGIDAYFGSTMYNISTRLRGTRKDGTPRGVWAAEKQERIPQLWIVSNPHPDMEQFDSFISYSESATGFCTIAVPFNKNTAMSASQTRATVDRVMAAKLAAGDTIEDAMAELNGQQTGYGGGEVFSKRAIENVIDLDYDISPYIISDLYGPHARSCFEFVVPPQKEHVYLITGDPGTAPAPNRNAPAIAVWDVTHKPVVMVALFWGSPIPGEYTPFIQTLKKYIYTYNARAIIDTTSAQILLLHSSELAELRDYIIPADFSGDFKRNAQWLARVCAESGVFKVPNYTSLRVQLRRYAFDDRKLRQDMVITILLLAYWMNSNLMLREEQTDDTESTPGNADANSRHQWHSRDRHVYHDKR